MNYTLIGQDGKKYGPAQAEHVRQWITEGRVDQRTPVFVEGTADWTFLGLLPEFAPYFAGPPPTITGLKPVPAQIPRTHPLAIWGLVCGILSWTFCCCCFPVNILGLVFSIIALVQIQSHPEAQEGRGLAIAGIVLSGASLLCGAGVTLMNLLTQSANWNMTINH